MLLSSYVPPARLLYSSARARAFENFEKMKQSAEEDTHEKREKKKSARKIRTFLKCLSL